ncbi:MAG: NAD-dependent deacylase [Paludibacteraceae bacterium]|nr:NAD-dependent deacylase [Paludibacteraceae bacterium]MBO7368257.1 NAD-dependent deacylase [Paludibacteraceae bacterium]
MPNIVVFTGAGVSADSGIATFRDSDGLWANHRIEDVCTAEAMIYNRKGVIDFYNERRKELLEKKPNAAHTAIAALERHFPVQVITQNVDDLHERAGSTHITHLHGELTKLRSSRDERATVPIEGWKQEYDARHPDGSLLRPFIVFFGESVPNLSKAIELTQKADIFIVVGTSLKVYPAASLLQYVRAGVPVYLVDPGTPDLVGVGEPFTFIKKRAADGVPELVNQLIKELS